MGEGQEKGADTDLVIGLFPGAAVDVSLHKVCHCSVRYALMLSGMPLFCLPVGLFALNCTLFHVFVLYVKIPYHQYGMHTILSVRYVDMPAVCRGGAPKRWVWDKCELSEDPGYFSFSIALIETPVLCTKAATLCRSSTLLRSFLATVVSTGQNRCLRL